MVWYADSASPSQEDRIIDAINRQIYGQQYVAQRRQNERAVADRRALEAAAPTMAGAAAMMSAPPVSAEFLEDALATVANPTLARQRAQQQYVAQQQAAGQPIDPYHADAPAVPGWGGQRPPNIRVIDSGGTPGDFYLSNPAINTAEAQNRFDRAKLRAGERSDERTSAINLLGKVGSVIDSYVSQGAAPPQELSDAFTMLLNKQASSGPAKPTASPNPLDDPAVNPLAASPVGRPNLNAIRQRMGPTIGESLQRGIFGSDTSPMQLRRMLDEAGGDPTALQVFKQVIEGDPMLRDALRAAQLAKRAGSPYGDSVLSEALRLYESQ